MSITGISLQATTPPAWLPVRPAGGSSAFTETLRAQIRAELAGAATADASGTAATTDSAAIAGRAAALRQSLLTSSNPADTAVWTKLTRNIGGQYLAPDVADVFTRQIALESGNFDPNVIYGRRVSSAGAEGIAQLMPSSYPNVNRLDPTASLNAAAETMRANLNTYGGDIRKALAAYNAGPGTVNSLVAQRGAGWETSLPDETRIYLRAILGDGNGR